MSRWIFRSRSFLAMFALPFLASASRSATPTRNIESVSISPDGKVLAITVKDGSAGFIYKVVVETGTASRLTLADSGQESSPSFSPDGMRIAYAYWPGKGARSKIIIVNVDGSDPREWPPSRGDDLSPIFSPDNKTIVFSRSGYFGSYSPIAEPHPHAWSFYASDLDGTNMRELTTESFYMASLPSISPDGKTMVVVTEGLNTSSKIAIYSLDRAGQPVLLLQPHVPKEADHKNPIFNRPNYMPDGKSILFMAASNGRLGHGYDYDVYRLNIGTTALERLTNGNGYATDLRVSADGRTAVFLKWRSDWHGTPVKSALYLLDVQAHRVMPLKVNGLELSK